MALCLPAALLLPSHFGDVREDPSTSPTPPFFLPVPSQDSLSAQVFPEFERPWDHRRLELWLEPGSCLLEWYQAHSCHLSVRPEDPEVCCAPAPPSLNLIRVFACWLLCPIVLECCLGVVSFTWSWRCVCYPPTRPHLQPCVLWGGPGLVRAHCFPSPLTLALPLTKHTARVHPMCLWVDARSCHTLSVCT